MEPPYVEALVTAVRAYSRRVAEEIPTPYSLSDRVHQDVLVTQAWQVRVLGHRVPHGLHTDEVHILPEPLVQFHLQERGGPLHDKLLGVAHPAGRFLDRTLAAGDARRLPAERRDRIGDVLRRYQKPGVKPPSTAYPPCCHYGAGYLEPRAADSCPDSARLHPQPQISRQDIDGPRTQ